VGKPLGLVSLGTESAPLKSGYCPCFVRGIRWSDVLRGDTPTHCLGQLLHVDAGLPVKP
jgi:hypothetical protein